MLCLNTIFNLTLHDSTPNAILCVRYGNTIRTIELQLNSETVYRRLNVKISIYLVKLKCVNEALKKC